MPLFLGKINSTEPPKVKFIALFVSFIGLFSARVFALKSIEELYKSGVFTGSCGTSLDHGVLAVGYGSEDGNDYYLVKNSWGTTWGDQGYIKLGRGSEYNKGAGQCGMLMQASYPIV